MLKLDFAIFEMLLHFQLFVVTLDQMQFEFLVLEVVLPFPLLLVNRPLDQ